MGLFGGILGNYVATSVANAAANRLRGRVAETVVRAGVAQVRKQGRDVVEEGFSGYVAEQAEKQTGVPLKTPPPTSIGGFVGGAAYSMYSGHKKYAYEAGLHHNESDQVLMHCMTARTQSPAMKHFVSQKFEATMGVHAGD